MANKHDSKVKSIAKSLEKKGWNVKADIAGYKKPDPIGKEKFIPDVQATKKGGTRLYEVETKDSMEKDKEQRETFRRSAAHRNKTTFEIIKA
jgi:hypothetical protein